MKTIVARHRIAYAFILSEEVDTHTITACWRTPAFALPPLPPLPLLLLLPALPPLPVSSTPPLALPTVLLLSVGAAGGRGCVIVADVSARNSIGVRRLAMLPLLPLAISPHVRRDVRLQSCQEARFSDMGIAKEDHLVPVAIGVSDDEALMLLRDLAAPRA